MKAIEILLIFWMLMALSAKAENSYPAKQIIAGDTVICSTIEQQRTYLQWKNALEECKEFTGIQEGTIYLMDSVIRAQKKLIAFQDIQTEQYKKLQVKMDEIVKLQTDKFKVMESAFRTSEKRNRKSKFIIGFTTGTVTLALIGLVTYKLITK